jgi:hypothetical protein
MMAIVLGLNIVVELLMPIPFMSFFIDGFFIKMLGFKRMYKILIVDTAIFYFTKLNVFLLSGELLGMWFPILMFALLPVAVILELYSIVVFNWLFQKLFADVYRRITQI